MKKQKNAPQILPREEWPYEVPENWVWTTIESLYEINPKNVAEDSLLASFVPMEKIAAGMASEFSFDVKTWGEIKRGHTQFADGDIAFAKISPCFENRKSMIVQNLKNGIGAGTTELIILRNRKVNPRYTYWLISTDNFIKKGVCTYSGTVGQQRINMQYVREYPVPLPPLPEQQRIVARIESLFAKLDTAAEKIRAALDQFPTRKAAILHKAFTGELTKNWREENGINNTWKTVPLKDIGEIITGSTPSTKHAEYYNGNIPFIKPTELDQGRKIMTSAEMLTAQGLSVSRPIRVGATCVCCIGATIGKCGYLAVDGVTNQQINSIIPYEFIDDLFVYYYCCSTKFKNDLIQNSSATTLPIINKSRMSSLEINYPQNENEQKEIVRILDAIFEREQAAKETAERLLIRIALIKKSILARAFRGLLGTNDPKEESAEGWLEYLYHKEVSQ